MDDATLAFTTFDDGTGPALYAGGGFRYAGGALAIGVARWDGSMWTSLNSGFNSEVSEFAVLDHGPNRGSSLYVGGTFETSAAGDSFLAEWMGCPSGVPSDLNQDGAVNALDLSVLLGAWGSRAGDINADGTTNSIDLALPLGAWTGT